MIEKLLKHLGLDNILSVAAGSPGEVRLVNEGDRIHIPETIPGTDNVDMSNLEAFHVVGNSMSLENIRKGDILFGKKLGQHEKTQIKNGDLVVFKVDPVLYKKHYPDVSIKVDFKLRKFCDYINLSLDDETILAKVSSVIHEVELKKCRDHFFKKLARARQDFENETLILLSVTYLESENRLDFSLHPLKDLFAKIEYIAELQKSGETLIVANILPVASTTEQRTTKAIDYLVENKINRFITGSKESFRIKVLAKIITEAQSNIRGSFNDIDDIFGNSDLLDSLITFFAKEGYAKILIYNKPDGDLDNILKKYDLLDYKHLLSIKTSNGVKFTRDGIGITFCVGDDSMYVLRPNATKPLVECNFNNTISSKDLIDLFDGHFTEQENI